MSEKKKKSVRILSGIAGFGGGVALGFYGKDIKFFDSTDEQIKRTVVPIRNYKGGDGDGDGQDDYDIGRGDKDPEPLDFDVDNFVVGALLSGFLVYLLMSAMSRSQGNAVHA